MIKNLRNKFFKLSVFIYDSAIFLFNKGRNDSILIIRLDAIGDFILWIDSAQHFRKIFPAKKIVLLGNKVWTEVAEKLPCWDKVWALDRLNFEVNPFYRFKLLRKIRKAGFDVVIQSSYSRSFLFGDAIVRISGARERIGSIGDLSNIYPFEKRISDRFYTWLIPADPHPLMELKRNAEFVRGLGVKTEAKLPDLNHALTGIKNPVQCGNSYYVLFPGASRSGKQWPINNFAVLAKKIYQRTGWTGVVCGSRFERDLAKSLISFADVPALAMAGETSLGETAVIIKGAKLVVANDTSAIHFAAAVSTPAFCLLGGGHYGRFMPYDLDIETERPLPVPIINKMDCFGCNWQCRYPLEKGAAVPCITNIKVDEVFDLMKPTLEARL